MIYKYMFMQVECLSRKKNNNKVYMHVRHIYNMFICMRLFRERMNETGSRYNTVFYNHTFLCYGCTYLCIDVQIYFSFSSYFNMKIYLVHFYKFCINRSFMLIQYLEMKSIYLLFVQMIIKNDFLIFNDIFNFFIF